MPENHDCPRIDLAHLPKEDVQPVLVGAENSFEYKVTFSPFGRQSRGIHFSGKELLNLFVGMVLVVGVALSLFLYSVSYVLLGLFVLVFTVSFFVHEFAHKIVAQRKGVWAEFRLTSVGAILTLVSIFSPLKFISPGAVMVSGSADGKSMGEIAVAGPMTNIVLSMAFLSSLLVAPTSQILIWGMWFNAWISFFNLIPFWVFDGLKIFTWNQRVWALALAASLALTVYSFMRIL